uniref:hypothetical protein n=1 Tax=Enterobacter hormaechei TaxID=158836 RepID=UPI001F22E528|nr:hypothetical protein [Enterobacter hormaechei]
MWVHDFIHRQNCPLHPDERRPVRADVPDFIDAVRPAVEQIGVVSENGIYGHSRFCNTDFDDKLACLNLSGV